MFGYFKGRDNTDDQIKRISDGIDSLYNIVVAKKAVKPLDHGFIYIMSGDRPESLFYIQGNSLDETCLVKLEILNGNAKSTITRSGMATWAVCFFEHAGSLMITPISVGTSGCEFNMSNTECIEGKEFSVNSFTISE
jgi:hypothetical protein